MKRTITLISVALLFLTGCSKPTVDTSSGEAMKSSMEKVKASLPEDQRDDFEEAVGIVAFSGFDLSDLYQASQLDTGATERKMKEALDGKTGEEIISLAIEIKAENEAKLAHQKKVRELLSEARELLDDENLVEALRKYQETLSFNGDSEEAEKGIEETKHKIDDFKEKKAYLWKVNLYNLETSTIDTYSE